MSKKAYHAALALLARQEYTAKALQQKLESKGFNEEEVVSTLDSLKETGLQSDERYAESYLKMRKKKGFGPNYIRKALLEKGICPERIDAIIRLETWLASAMGAWQKKYKSYSNDVKLQARQKQFLYYRGFDTDTIHQLFSELSSDSEYVDNEKC